MLTGAGIVTRTFLYDHIDRVEITASQGGGRLVDLCVWGLAAGANAGWQVLPGFTYPMALPVRHPAYPASGGLPTDRASSEALATGRVQYGPPSAVAGTAFEDLHDDYLVPLVSAGAGGMRSVLTSEVGEAEPRRLLLTKMSRKR